MPAKTYRVYTLWDWVAFVVFAVALIVVGSICIPQFAHAQDSLPPDVPAPVVSDPAPVDLLHQLFEQAWGLIIAAVMALVAAGLARAKAAALKKLDTVITGVAISNSPQAKSSIKSLAEERGIESGLAKVVVATETKNADLIKKKTTMSFDPKKIAGEEEV